MHGDGRMEYFYKNDKNLLGKCEPAFGGGIRNYRSRGSGLWKGWVTFEAVEGAVSVRGRYYIRTCSEEGAAGEEGLSSRGKLDPHKGPQCPPGADSGHIRLIMILTDRRCIWWWQSRRRHAE